MKKILSLFFVLTLSLISLVTLTACDKTKAEDLLRTFLIEEDGKNVKENFSVPAELTSGEETYELTWSSNNQNLTIGEKVDKNYVVNVARPAQDEAATLTVTLKLSKKNTATKDFTIYLSPIDVYDFVDEFSQPGVFKENGTSVTTDFALATEYALTNHPTEKATITWVSNNTDALAISEDGKTALVYPSSEEVSVRLTATFTYKGETSQAKFTVKVSSPKTPYENLMYWYNNTGITQTISGYVVCVAAEYSESYGNISLYVIDDTLKGGYYLYRTKASADEAAKLLDENGNFKLGVHVTVTGASNTSYNGLMETNAGGNLVVDTDVTPINVEETYYAIDNDLLANAQSLYYRMSTLVTLTNWKVKELGDPIEAGANSTVLVLEKNGYEIKIRYSKYIQNALGEDNAAAFQAGLAGIAVGDYVNVKGLLSYYNSDKEAYDADSYQIFMTAPDSVTKGTQDDAELLGVKVGAALEAFDALAELYVAPTTVTLPTELNGVTIAWSIPESNVAKSVALEENKLTLTPQTKLETVNVIGTYTNGAYSTVVYYSFKTQSLSDAEMIDKALEELVIEDQYAPKDVTLPASNELYGVTFSYALKGTPTSVTLAEGVLTVDNSTLTEDEKVTLVVTATKGESSKEVEIEITVHKLEVITIAKFLENKDKDTVSLLEGVITAVNKVGESGSFVLTDAAGTSIFCYSGLNVTLGDEIQVLGVYAENYSFPQIGNPVLVKTISTGNDVEAKSGTKVEYTTAEISTKINDSTLTDATCAAAFSGQYLQIRGYVYEASSATLVKMSTDSSSETEVVRIYANSGLALNEYLNKEITILCFARGTNLTSKYITVQAQAVVLSDAEKVSIAKEALSLDVTETLVDFTLPVTGEQGTTITWESNNAAIAVSGANATVTRPAVGAEDATVKLTATITSGSATDTKEFTVTVKAQSADPNVDKVAADKAELTIITTAYKNLTLPTEGTEGSAITWASSNEEVIATNGTITPSADATVVTLTATLTLGDVTETKIFEVTVLPQATVAEFLTAKNTEKAVVLTGIITAVNRPSEGLSSFVLTDAAGTSIFCYSGLAVALGDEVI